MCTTSSLSKPAVRLLGIAESTPPDSVKTILAGVVMRTDNIIDGMVWGTATIGGMDATDAVIELVQRIARTDLGGVLLHGCIIAGYNVIDLQRLHQLLNLPIISVTREPQEDIHQHLLDTFPDDWQLRWDIIRRNGTIQPMELLTGITVFAQFYGTKHKIVQALLKRITRFGGVPEPIRVARLFARALVKMPLA